MRSLISTSASFMTQDNTFHPFDLSPLQSNASRLYTLKGPSKQQCVSVSFQEVRERAVLVFSEISQKGQQCVYY